MSQAIMEYVMTGRNEFFASKVNTDLFPKAEYRETPTHTFCLTGIHAPFGNALWQHSSSLAGKQEIGIILDTFKQKQLPFFWWETPIPIGLKDEEAPQSPNLREILVENELQVGGLLKGVCAHLNSASTRIHHPTVIIRPVQSSSELKRFCQLIYSIHGAGAQAIEEVYTLAEKSTQAKEEINYLAYQDNKPIGGITLATGKKTAGLWNFATHETHRRQGVGSALIQEALLEAKKQGYHELMAILMPSEMGTLWRQFHFQEICHFPFYIGLGQAEISEEKAKRVRKKGAL